jgi:hypothetical protein
VFWAGAAWGVAAIAASTRPRAAEIVELVVRIVDSLIGRAAVCRRPVM